MQGRALEELTIGVSGSQDPADPRFYSGGPASLVAALRDLGVTVVPITGAPDSRVFGVAFRLATAARLRPSDRRRLQDAKIEQRPQARKGRLLQPIRAAHIRRQVERAPQLDGIVQYGVEHLLPRGPRRVTFEDATVRQATEWAWEWSRGARPADHRFYEARARRAYAAAIATCARSRWAADSMVRDFGQPPDKVKVTGVGANYRPEADPSRNWSVPTFLFVGKDWERKNGDLVVRAFRDVRQRHPGATLHLVGGHPPIVEEGVTGHGLLRLEVAEERDRLTHLYQRATAFVMPSLHEPAGFVYAEAQFAGIASIGTTNGGAST
ncbi:MAG TPA: glycosyltransferase family 4 protein, partial [Baekduia sp.]